MEEERRRDEEAADSDEGAELTYKLDKWLDMFYKRSISAKASWKAGDVIRIRSDCSSGDALADAIEAVAALADAAGDESAWVIFQLRFKPGLPTGRLTLYYDSDHIEALTASVRLDDAFTVSDSSLDITVTGLTGLSVATADGLLDGIASRLLERCPKSMFNDRSVIQSRDTGEYQCTVTFWVHHS